MNNPLSRELATKMAGVVNEINSLENGPDKDATKAAELKTELASFFVEHASEFLGSWLAVANEYEPLVHSFAALQRRAAGLNAMRMQQQAEQAHHAQAESVKEEASSIIIPGRFNRKGPNKR